MWPEHNSTTSPDGGFPRSGTRVTGTLLLPGLFPTACNLCPGLGLMRAYPAVSLVHHHRFLDETVANPVIQVVRRDRELSLVLSTGAP